MGTGAATRRGAGVPIAPGRTPSTSASAGPAGGVRPPTGAGGSSWSLASVYGPAMTDRPDNETWAGVGRRVDALAAELTAEGWEVAVRWDRPKNQVWVQIGPRP